MKFSLFFEQQISQPTPATEAAMFHASVAQAELADRLGYHAVWAVEHHGLREYSHSSAPEVFLAFVAARTTQIRLGHGVTLLPFRYNHPIRVAERIATLDILSGGRVLFGSGKSSSTVELVAFQNTLDEVHDQWLEALRIIPRMWREEVFEHRGRFFDIPATQIIPKPVQLPHPPLYAACSRAETSLLAAQLGLGALCFAQTTEQTLRERVADYRRAARDAKPIGEIATHAFACTPHTVVLAKDAEACRYGFRGSRFFAQTWAGYYRTRGERPRGDLPIRRGELDELELSAAYAQRDAPGLDMNTIVGDPVRAREQVSRFVDAGVDELILIMQLGEVPDAIVRRSIKTFGEKVMPHFG